MKSHLETAREYGVRKALEKCGYASADDVQKEASALGLLEQPAPAKTASDKPLENVFASLKSKLGG